MDFIVIIKIKHDWSGKRRSNRMKVAIYIRVSTEKRKWESEKLQKGMVL